MQKNLEKVVKCRKIKKHAKKCSKTWKTQRRALLTDWFNF